MTIRRFPATLAAGPRGRLVVPVPFDPDRQWGAKARHHITGNVGGARIRGVVEPIGDGHGIALGAIWARDCPYGVGDTVTVEIEPEGPQRDDLAPDIAEALAAQPEAAEFFDALATFYRKGYLRWIDATTRRPELREARIAEMVELLKAGHKQRPRGETAVR